MTAEPQHDVGIGGKSSRNPAVPADRKQPGQLTSIWRVIVEIGLIMFSLYSILLMREFTQANEHGKSLALAIRNIFTLSNFLVAIISGLVGSLVLGYLEERG